MRLDHWIERFVFPDSRVLVLGSFPSVKSREVGFYYGHPQNRFWLVLSGVLGVPAPGTIEDKKEMLRAHRVALWDVIESCEITGSMDSAIKDPLPTAIAEAVRGTDIRAVFINGQTAGKLYQRHQAKTVSLPYFILPSTSPANAAFSVDRLLEHWKVIADYLK
ncbi:MAG TPA: DNA-deoxyinosine glycosylase [Candidatus Limnocylindria bacterium]|nr:DNA-deoxyinosine glycosylase [Candidatus Limnocylindria bacterium]